MKRACAGGGNGREREPAKGGKPGMGGAGRTRRTKKPFRGRDAGNPKGAQEKSGSPKAESRRSEKGEAAPAGGTPLPADSQNRLAERLLLEQSIARVVNGQTGLLTFLDMLLHDAEEKDLAGFMCHAEGYIRRMEKLEPLFARCKTLDPRNPELALYRKLLKLGKELREKAVAMPSGGLSDRQLDAWREEVLQRIDLYGNREKP